MDLVLLYLFHGVLELGLILSSSMAFVLAFFVSFYLQKFWTFRNADTQKIPKQLSIYLLVGTTNLTLNALIIHTAVNRFHIYYLLAQIVSTATLSIWGFLMNKFVIFKNELRERTIKRKYGERTRERFFVLINAEDVEKFRPTEDFDFRGIVLGSKDSKFELPNFRLIIKSKNKLINFLQIAYETRKWIYWTDKVKCFCLGEIALPGYVIAKLAGKKFILQTKNEGKTKGWQKRIIKGMDEVIIP